VRVIAPLLATIASVVTIVAGVVRIKWANVQQRVHDSTHTGREALPVWVKRVATGWLLLVGGTLTIVFLYIVVKTIIDYS